LRGAVQRVDAVAALDRIRVGQQRAVDRLFVGLAETSRTPRDDQLPHGLRGARQHHEAGPHERAQADQGGAPRAIAEVAEWDGGREDHQAAERTDDPQHEIRHVERLLDVGTEHREGRVAQVVDEHETGEHPDHRDPAGPQDVAHRKVVRSDAGQELVGDLLIGGDCGLGVVTARLFVEDGGHEQGRIGAPKVLLLPAPQHRHTGNFNKLSTQACCGSVNTAAIAV
jgi:hypothetical protein